jgi:protein TonB
MMTQDQLATASLNDIVFDGRNKEYGAYELRALYERHVTRALLIGTALLLMLLAFPFINGMLAEVLPATPVRKPGVIDLIDVPLDQTRTVTPPPVAPPPTRAAAAPPVNTTRFVDPVVAKPTETVTEDIPDQDALRTAIVGTQTITNGTDEPTLDLLKDPKDTGPVGDVVDDSKPYISVQQMPELPTGGGAAGIVAAIQKAASYPRAALSNGVEGRVYVSFVVNALGDVTDIKIVKGLGFGLDEETIRAIKTLPRFTPGRQNGQAVSVQFTVPVTFNIK